MSRARELLSRVREIKAEEPVSRAEELLRKLGRVGGVGRLPGSGPDPLNAWRELVEARTGRASITTLQTESERTIKALQAFSPNLRFYDVIIVNTSGGKDSIAMSKEISKLAKKQGVYNRLLMVHADLGEAEWTGTKQLAQQHAHTLDLPFQAVAHPVALGARVQAYGKMPSKGNRYCTGEFKTAQINKLMTRLLENLTGTKGGVLTKVGLRPVRFLNVLGIRADESDDRANKPPFHRAKSNSRRVKDDWYPIHEWSHGRVMRSVNQGPLRPPESYACGLSRHSCKFCIMASQPDLLTAALLDPAGTEQWAARQERMMDPRLNPWDEDVVRFQGKPITVLKRKRPGAKRPHRVKYEHAGKIKEVTIDQWKALVQGAQVVSLGPSARDRVFPVLGMAAVKRMADELRAQGVDPRKDPAAARIRIEERLVQQRIDKAWARIEEAKKAKTKDERTKALRSARAYLAKAMHQEALTQKQEKRAREGVAQIALLRQRNKR